MDANTYYGTNSHTINFTLAHGFSQRELSAVFGPDRVMAAGTNTYRIDIDPSAVSLVDKVVEAFHFVVE